MGKRVKNLRFLLIICGWIGGILFIVFAVYINRKQEGYSEDYVMSSELPSLLQFTYYTKDEWEERLEDTGKLKGADVRELLAQLNLTEYIEAPDDEQLVSRNSWYEIYAQIVSILDENETVAKKSIMVLQNHKKQVLTQNGTYQTAQNMDWLEENHSYEVYCVEDKILGIVSKDKEDVTLTNGYILSCKNQKITFLLENEEYTMSVKSEEMLENVVADLILRKGKIIKIRKKEDCISGKLLSMDEGSMEIEGYGQVKCDSMMRIYSIYEGVEEVQREQLLLENMKLTFVVADEQVCAILLEEPAAIEKIRVLLLNENQKYRSDVFLVSDSAMKISYQETEQPLEAGTVVSASSQQDAMAAGCVTVSSQDGTSPLYLADEQGNRIGMGYAGVMELRKYEQGYTVVNVVDFEEYLKGVITSEVPSSFDADALKAQAVCARSYAYRQLMGTGYQTFGAHVDDSVNYQVYNKKEQTPEAAQAVADTRGEVMSMNGNVIETFYFSTSFGHTGNFEAWNLPEETYPYLQGIWIRPEDGEADLSDEASFAAYIGGEDESCYESSSKYFRWTAVLDFTGKEEQVKNVIMSRKEKQPEAVHFYTRDKGAELEQLENPGALENVQVTARNKSGVITELVLEFQNGVVTLHSEYNIRAVLGCGGDAVTFRDAATAEMTILPSAYISIAKQEDGTYLIHGGGYGHGIGMSQNGAQQLALAGMDYKNILTRFYQNAEVTSLYE